MSSLVVGYHPLQDCFIAGKSLEPLPPPAAAKALFYSQSRHRVNDLGYGNSVAGLDNPQRSPSTRVSSYPLETLVMDEVQRLDSGRP